MITQCASLLQKPALLLLLIAVAGLSTPQPTQASNNLKIWDTSSPLGNSVDVNDRTGWKEVPGDLITLEADPAKSASDPGYYGREYAFKGDAVVENHALTAVFWSAKGRIVLYSKPNAAAKQGAESSTKIAEIAPLPTGTESATIKRCEILRNAGDEVCLAVFFSNRDPAEVPTIYSFDKSQIMEIKPGPNMKGVRLFSPIEYGVVPGFLSDDLIYAAGNYPDTDTLCVPSENLFLGMLPGENHELVMTWPKGKQQVSLRLGSGEGGKRLITSVDFQNDGQSLYVSAIGAPGVWHREVLGSSYLEKDVESTWKMPFSATWKTQLTEEKAKTTFAFHVTKGQVWRGVPGSYIYPVWFNEDRAYYHLSKKIPPQGESLVYFVEGNDTPNSISTPAEILKATLGRATAEELLDSAGRKLRTHHRRGGDGVRRACTCGCTEAIQAVFEAGEEVQKKADICAAVDDMVFFVERHVARIEEYRRFADAMSQFIQTNADSTPELKAYLDSLHDIVQQIPQEYTVQKENMKSPEYASELVRKTVALTGKKDPQNLAAYMELLKDWRGMGGAQDYVVAQCHMITRKLFQEAGYGCAKEPKAALLAQEIRSRCKQVLRNPDGYEIWANY